MSMPFGNRRFGIIAIRYSAGEWQTRRTGTLRVRRFAPQSNELRARVRDWKSVAGAGARIDKALPGYRNKLPVIRIWLEHQLEDPEGGRIAQFAVGLGRAEGPVILAAGAHDEFANATRRIGSAVRSLWREALVVMVVAVYDDIHVRFIQGLPNGFDFRIVAVSATRTEQRLVPIGEGTTDGMRSKIGA